MNRLLGRELLEQPLDHRLHGGEDVLLRHEAHLDIQLVEVGGRAVGARVFIAETGRDLEIAVEARHHDQLLELLRRLRQRVELTRMQARGHQKVARTLGAGGGDDRRLELGKTAVPHPVADRPHHVGPQHHLAVQPFAPQIEEAIGQPRFLGILLIAEHRQRELLGRAQHLDLTRIDLDLAGRDLGVHKGCIAQLHRAVDPHHPFGAHLFQRRKGRAVAVTDDLGHPVMVAQVEEQHPAMIAHPVDPARQAHGLAGVILVECGTGMAAIGVHGRPLPRGIWRRGRYTAAGPGSQGTARAGIVPDAAPIVKLPPHLPSSRRLCL